MKGISFSFDPEYLEEIDASATHLEVTFLTYWSAESGKDGKISEFARHMAASSTLGRLRLAYLTLMAQMVPQLRGYSNTRRALFELAKEILAMAVKLITSNAERLQVGRTNWKLGTQAFELYLPDISTTYLTRAAETYVRLRHWSVVAMLYKNLGLSELSAGYAGRASGWMNLSAEVYRSLKDEHRAAEIVQAWDIISREPSKFFAPLMQLQQLQSSTSGQGLLGLVEMYPVGLVSLCSTSTSMFDSLQMADIFGDTLLDLIDKQWPSGAITAAAIDLRTISRILRDPNLLDDLEPRALEVLVATLFEGFAAEVELTKETRDGGYDVGARFKVGDICIRVLIEAKKWREGRKVGIAAVDRLMGVKYRLGADKVVLVTSSSFSTVAREAAAQMRCEIELVDRGGLSEWVRQYLLPVEGSAIVLPSIHIPSG